MKRRSSERSGPATNTVFNRSVMDIITADHGVAKEVTPIPFTMPKEVHPIAKFFNERARYNAATMHCRAGEVVYLRNVDQRNFYSHQHSRPPNPAYFFATEIPYPVGYRDTNGAAMTYGWTPLGYLFYYDRANTGHPVLNEIREGKHRPFNRDLWTGLFLHGLMINFDQPVIRELAKALAYTDPPAQWLVDMMWPVDHETRQNGGAMLEFEQAAADFQHNWNCGAWFHRTSDAQTERALRTVLAI